MWGGGCRAERGGPKKTWGEIMEKDCKARGLNRENAWIVVDGESR